MEIKKAVREQTYTMTSIAGPSGSGKTYTALIYARGLVGPGGKIGLIDTENKRSRHHSDVAGGFDVIDLEPPFTPGRYIEAIESFVNAGYSAIIVDSTSHEWEGTGGVVEMAEALEVAHKKSGLNNWAKPKAAHKKLMQCILQANAHLIFCCRVKEKIVQAKDEKGRSVIINEGFVVVQEKGFVYEMTITIMLDEATHFAKIGKCPDSLRSAFPENSYVQASAGAAVRMWSEEGIAIDKTYEAIKRAGTDAANQGLSALAKWWDDLGAEKRRTLGALKNSLKSIADAADEMRATVHDAGLGDPGERLAHKRATNGKPDPDEGFDLHGVKSQTAEVFGTRDAGADEDGFPGDSAAGTSAPAASHAGADSTFLLDLFKTVWAARGPDPDVIDIQATLLEDRWIESNAATQGKARVVLTQVKMCGAGEISEIDCKRYLAGIVGCELRDMTAAEG